MIVGWRRFAFVTAVFTSGAVLLGVEIAASRVIAPFFGSSLFVWGALIGVVLTGLAIGYWAGGALADRLPSPLLLVSVMGLGALSVLAIPLVDEPVLEAIVSWDPGPRANPLVAAVALFGPMSVILAGVTPIAVRLAADTVATLGRAAGRLFSISTAGSIVGTFATAFFLVPEFGTDQLLAVAAATLLAATALFALTQRLLVPAVALLLALGGAGIAARELAPEEGGRLTGAAARNWSPLYRTQRERTAADPGSVVAGFDLVYRKSSRYHNIYVVDDDDSRYLRFDNSFQSGMFLGRPFETRFAYSDYFHLGLAYNPAMRDVLFIGLGGGSAPKRLWRDLPELRLQVVELDPEVEKVARRYFALPDDPRLRVAVEDGRRYLDRTDERWDMIAIDAYYSDSIPFHLTTLEFLDLAKSRLAPGGVVIANIIGAIEGPESRLFRSLYRTYSSVFPTVLVHPVREPGDEGDPELVRNIILVATDRPAAAKRFLEARWRQERSDNPRLPDLGRAIDGRYASSVRVDDIPVLTDDYAPTDALLLD